MLRDAGVFARQPNEKTGTRPNEGCRSLRCRSIMEAAVLLVGGNSRPGMEELKKKLEDEIAALDIELRIDLPREIAKARAHGDLSENAEYHAAKERQGIVNARLGQLRARLRELSMIDLSRIPRDRAGLGSTVTVLDLQKDEEIVYKLVTSEEANVAEGRISTTSPIGKALLGKQVGDAVKVQIPGGTREMEITKLATIHEAARE